MKITVSRNQLKQLIKEEANRYKRVIELKTKREEILKQLNELYGEMDMAMPDSGPGLEDESWLGDLGGKIAKKTGDVFLGSDDTWKRRLEIYFSRQPGRVVPQTDQEWAEAIRAAKLAGDVRIIKNREGKWVPIMKIDTGTGAGFDALGESIDKKK